VDLEVLHIDDCRNWREAATRLRAALDSTGHADEAITFRMLRTSEASSERPSLVRQRSLSTGST
jgi:hypothetical protein